LAQHGDVEGGVLTTGSRQYAEKPAAALMQIGHVVVDQRNRCEFATG
jgi:hypothetical protein